MAAALLLAGCGGRGPEPPKAAIQVVPAAVCEGDDYQHVVLLDASQSKPELTILPRDVDSGVGLSYRWRFEGSAYRIVSGSLDAETIGVKIAADRPLHVYLTVTTSTGASATTLLTVPIIVGCGGGG